MTPWQRFCGDWKGKRVLIMGLGLQGRGIGDARMFCEAGASVTATDLRTEEQLQPAMERLKGFNIRYVLGRHDENDFRSSDLVLRNPDVPSSSPFLKIAMEAGIPIKMDSSLFAAYSPLPIIGITGTRGKTTTTMMIYEILKKLYSGQVFLAGNIPEKATLELLKEVTQVAQARSPIVILELSSWELEGWNDEKVSPHVGVITNFYEDHLNRYKSMEDYWEDKLFILRHQKKTDWAVLNRDNPWTKKSSSETKAKIKWFSANDLPEDVLLTVPGEHNRANAAAALAAVSAIEVDNNKALKILTEFKSVLSRLETIATIDDVEYINDTTSTTPAAGVAALKAMKKPIILIAGGSSKKLNLKPFAKEIVKRVKNVVWLTGEGTDEILREIQNSLPADATHQALQAGKFKVQNLEQTYDNLEKAMEKAKSLAKPGEVVLLSPGCASFSMFKNEFDRGSQFNRIVLSWQKKS